MAYKAIAQQPKSFFNTYFSEKGLLMKDRSEKQHMNKTDETNGNTMQKAPEKTNPPITAMLIEPGDGQSKNDIMECIKF